MDFKISPKPKAVFWIVWTIPFEQSTTVLMAASLFRMLATTFTIEASDWSLYSSAFWMLSMTLAIASLTTKKGCSPESGASAVDSTSQFIVKLSKQMI